MIQNEFVSQFITVFNWARVKAKLTIARLNWPTETSQPTISRSKTRTNETIIGKQSHKPVTSKRLPQNGPQLSKNLVSKRSSVEGEWHGPMKTVNQKLLARYLKRKISEHQPINHLSQNELVSQRITAVKRAILQPQRSIAKLTRQKENNQPTTCCSKTPRNDYRKTYATTSWFKTSLWHDSSQVSPEHVSKRSYCEANLANWNKSTNNFSLVNANELGHYRNTSEKNQLFRNEFVSKLISAVNRASLKAKFSIARLTENSQPTISRSGPQTKETIVGKGA